MIAKLYRIIRWWLRCLWAGRVVPRILPGSLYSRSYMRKAWSPRLRRLDSQYNETRDPMLLIERRLMVAKRRAFRFS